MRATLLLLVAVIALGARPVTADERALAQARYAYNDGDYDGAIAAARVALAAETETAAARVVLARALLERFRQDDAPADLDAARDALRSLPFGQLSVADRADMLVALGQWLFLSGHFGAAAELFDTAAAYSPLITSLATRDRILDWWASAVDRQAQEDGGSEVLYGRVLERMEQELALDPASAAASYWIVAAARGRGELDRAWHAAMGGWVRAGLAPDRGAALRADLDRLVLTAVIPERARLAAESRGDQRQAADTMVTEWERFKAGWETPPPVSSSRR